MTTHTDRIRQMAQEAGIDESAEGFFLLSGEDLTRFAQLVAEDCANLVNDNPLASDAEAIRARYSLKD